MVEAERLRHPTPHTDSCLSQHMLTLCLPYNTPCRQPGTFSSPKCTHVEHSNVAPAAKFCRRLWALAADTRWLLPTSLAPPRRHRVVPRRCPWRGPPAWPPQSAPCPGGEQDVRAWCTVCGRALKLARRASSAAAASSICLLRHLGAAGITSHLPTPESHILLFLVDSSFPIKVPKRSSSPRPCLQPRADHLHPGHGAHLWPTGQALMKALLKCPVKTAAESRQHVRSAFLPHPMRFCTLLAHSLP